MSTKKSQGTSSTQYSCWPKAISNNEELLEVTIPSQRSYTTSPNKGKDQSYSSRLLTEVSASHYPSSIYSESPDSYYNNASSYLYDSYKQNLSYNSYPEDRILTSSSHTQPLRQSKVTNKKKRWDSDSTQPYYIPDQNTEKSLDFEESQHNDDLSSSVKSSGTRERRPRKQPHELLTESQKKANHIASEQKRRQNIRLGFEKLIDIVPSLNHGNRSESLILQKSVDHIKYLLSTKNELKNQVRYLQTTLGESKFDEDSSDDEHMFPY